MGDLWRSYRRLFDSAWHSATVVSVIRLLRFFDGRITTHPLEHRGRQFAVELDPDFVAVLTAHGSGHGFAAFGKQPQRLPDMEDIRDTARTATALRQVEQLDLEL